MKFSFYHITDTHYFSKKNYDTDPADLGVKNDQLLMRESEELFLSALDEVRADRDTDTVFITGDITNRGDIDSLHEVDSILTEAEKDLDIYAFTDTHDYFSDKSVMRVNKNNEIYFEEIDNKEEKDKIRSSFSRFGFDRAKYKYKDNFTCFIEVKKNIYYIELYNHENEKGLRVIDPDAADWVIKTAEELKKQNAFMFIGIHIPVMTPSPVYILLGNGSVPVNGEELAGCFADAGIRLILSGHTHMHSIRHKTTKAGNTIWEVGTGSLGGYPSKIRKITVDTDKCSLDIKSIKISPPVFGDKTAEEYGRAAFTGSISPVFYNMEHDIDKFIKVDGGVTLPEDAILKHRKLVMRAGKTLNNLTFGKAGDIIRRETGLKKYEYESIRDKKLIPALIGLIADLFAGNPGYDPYSAEYKVLMSYVSAGDSIIKTFKIDIKKLTGYPDLYSIAAPLIYKGDNDSLSVLYNVKPAEKEPPFRYKSNTGKKLIAAASVPFIISGAVIIKKLAEKLK